MESDQFLLDDGITAGCLFSSVSFGAGLCSACRLVCWLIDSFCAQFLCVPGCSAGMHALVSGLLTFVEAQCML